MFKKLAIFTILIASFLFANNSMAAIAYDSVSKAGPTTASSVTLSHTTSGDNRILFVYVIIKSLTASISNIKYNNVDMTALANARVGSSDSWMYTYYLINPASGANNIVINFSGSVKYQIHGISYTGAKQSDQPDAYVIENGSSIVTSKTATLTTIADNCWTVLFGGTPIDGGWGLTAGTNSTLRSSLEYSSAVFDRNAPKTPAGSTSMTAVGGGAGQISLIMNSFSPSASPGPANVKSVNGIILSSVKNKNGLTPVNTKTYNYVN